MYAPSYFSEADRNVLYRWIKQFPFGILVSHETGELTTSHLPFFLDRDRHLLIAHMARRNPHWHQLSEAQPATVIFSGPHCYISPTWLEKPNMVPTWNYLAVHVSGPTSLINEPHLKQQSLEHLVTYLESGAPSPWSLDQLSPRALEANLSQIMAFQIEIKHISGKKKFSQNHSPELRAKVIQKLREQTDYASSEVADFMEDML